MNTVDYKRMVKAQLEQLCVRHFGHDIEVAAVLFDDITVSHDGLLTLFVTPDGALYALCTANEPMVLADVQKIFRLVNLTVSEYLAPAGVDDYFVRAGREIFLQTYPGRDEWNQQEAEYYQTQAPYNPALVRLDPKVAEIRRFDNQIGQWHQTYDAAAVAEAFRTHAVTEAMQRK